MTPSGKSPGHPAEDYRGQLLRLSHIVDWARFRAIADQCGAPAADIAPYFPGWSRPACVPAPSASPTWSPPPPTKPVRPARNDDLTIRRDLFRLSTGRFSPANRVAPPEHHGRLAVALKLARSDEFRALQQRIVDNAARLAQQLQAHGLRIVGGSSAKSPAAHRHEERCPQWRASLGRQVAARILDLAGIVTNRNTIPGRAPLVATGVRIGTVWTTNWAMARPDRFAGRSGATVLKGCRPFVYAAPGGKSRRRSQS